MNLPVGAKAPDFELVAPDGRLLRLQEALSGGPVVLVFYRSGCPASQLTMPCLEKIYVASGKRSVARLVAVSQDDPGETRDYIAAAGLTFDVFVDEHPYNVSSAYELEYLPAIFVIDTAGDIRFSDWGFSKAALTEVSSVMSSGSGHPSTSLFSPNDGLPPFRHGCRARN
jgi:peroxiredoxin